MKKILVFVCCILLLSGCLRLDSQLFSNTQLTEYKFDRFDGKRELPEINSLYTVADNMINLFALTSNSKSGSAKIYAVYIGDISRIATDTVIVYCHGNSDHMDRYWNRAKLLANTGYLHRFGVLMFDYRGYGMSEGKPDEESLYADTDAALAWLKQKGLTDGRLVIYGYSLGTSAATEITANSFT